MLPFLTKKEGSVSQDATETIKRNESKESLALDKLKQAKSLIESAINSLESQPLKEGPNHG